MLNLTVCKIAVISSIAIAGLWGCQTLENTPLVSGLNSASVSAIASLSPTSANPVQIRGRVIQHIPLLNRSAYQLQDETGVVVVVATGNLPEIGTTVTIRGEVRYQSIPIEGQELGEVYIIEQP
ncbi:hypothetical protein [Roseofilum casamattae]|uniref:Uncharacterized protein n=1 Tax=Roseofilum casamattae BLCC-M143 TaxID=3022442 RepID=A0ABT7C248_9CYAN|nr:hypothetical protein [Roseofilum casamattae]MDJ1185532.1 hypothetical protein [Roseofilum casamattae BLCC-M143]